MSIRSQWCEFDKETRKYIKKRDKDKCFICNSKGGLQIAHIFLSRAKGGRGCKENGVLLCVKCHRILDNPIGKEENEKSVAIDILCRNYLKRVENIEDTKVLKEKLKFNKIEYIAKKEEKVANSSKKVANSTIGIKRCKSCSMLVKTSNNSTISNYYCKYKKVRISKSTKICDKFKEK